MNNLLEIRGVTKKYGSFKALDNVSLNLSAGKIVGLLGPNGSGKTTLIKIINGLLKDFWGEILVAGNPIGVESRKVISYLPDENYFQDWMYVKDVLNIFNDLYQDFDQENCLTLMKRFDLNPDMKIKSMSKGMKEKFQLCLVMLDVILNNYQKDALVLISTHLISDLETIFDEVVFLKEGKVVLHQETEELRLQRKQSIDEAFREVFKC